MTILTTSMYRFMLSVVLCSNRMSAHFIIKPSNCYVSVRCLFLEEEEEKIERKETNQLNG